MTQSVAPAGVWGRLTDGAALMGACVIVVMVAAYLSGYPPVAYLVIGGLVAIVTVVMATTSFELLTFLVIAARTTVELTHETGGGSTLRLSVLVTGAYTLVAAIWLVARRVTRPLHISAVAMWVTAVAAAALLSAVLSSDRTEALLGASRWMFLVVFVIALDNLIVDRRRVMMLLLAVVASSVVPLVLGVWQFAAGTGTLVDGVPRISGSFSHPNTYGFYLVVIGLMITAVLRRLTPIQKFIGAIWLGAVLISLLATYSRTSYAAFLVGIVVLAIVGRRRGLITVALVAVIGALLFPGVSDRIADVSATTTLRGTPGNSLTWRIDYWQEVIDAGASRQVTGLGLGVVSDLTDEGREPHNDIVRVLAELGLVGLVAYIGLIAALGWRVLRSLRAAGSRDRRDGMSRDLAQGFAAVFAAFVTASLTGNLMTQLVLITYVLATGVAATLPAERGRRAARASAADPMVAHV